PGGVGPSSRGRGAVASAVPTRHRRPRLWRILALFGGLSGTSDGGGPVWGGPPTAAAVGQIPADQLVVIQQVARSAPCTLAWTVLAAIANVESEFGRTADRTSAAGAYGYGQF